MFTKVPLAWQNLTYDARRLAIAVTGVGFAVLLIFMELGFLNALLDSTVRVIEQMEADLVLVNRGRFAMLAHHRFSVQRIHQARSSEGVAGVYPLYIEDSAVMRREGERGYPIRVFAFNTDQPVLNIPQAAQFAAQLNEPNTALVDTKSKARYGFPKSPFNVAAYQGELSGREVRLVGQFELGRDFANDGNLIVSATNFASFFPSRSGDDDPLEAVDVGIIRLSQPADLDAVRDQLVRTLPADVTVFSKQEFLDRERTFWRTRTPVGAIFMVGVAIGFVVGVTICYQIIYASVADHMPEFATLKAMGYPDRYFVRVVLYKALYLSILGFIPGGAVGWLLYLTLARQTGLMMEFKASVALTVLVFTMTMCAVSALFVIRKLKSADPAELF
jgi:putative ABC transport system permease protein